MSFENAIKMALVEASGQFPEIQAIEIGISQPGVSLYILINADDIEPVEAGECSCKPVKQSAQISIMGKITRNDSQLDVKDTVLGVGKKVLQALNQNLRLSSTIYPDSFLCSFASFPSIQSDFGMHGNDSVYYQNISIEGEYFL